MSYGYDVLTRGGERKERESEEKGVKGEGNRKEYILNLFKISELLMFPSTIIYA